MIKLRIKTLSQGPKFNVGDILDFVGCKMSSRKLLKLNGTPESLPTAWGLDETLTEKSQNKRVKKLV